MYAMLLLATSFIMFSCRKDDDGGGNNGGGAGEGTITAKVNGTQVTSASMTSTAQYVVTSGSFGALTMQGTTTDLKHFQLILANVTKATGTYDIGGTNSVMVNGSYMELTTGGSSQTWVAPYAGGAVVGSITISEWTDSKVVGTFKFKAALQTSGGGHDTSNIKDVTEGSFNLKF